MRRPPEALFALGRPFSPLYAMAMRLRALLYRKDLLLHPTRVSIPVISVGNLTMGGTGKTPMVLYLARLLRSMGKRPAIVSRGYGGHGSDGVQVVADGQRIVLSPEVAGDEPCMLANALADVPVLVGPRRAEVAREAIRLFGVDVIVMDDGFQHLALRRDLDLVLFSARTLLGNGRVFPGGDLRESVDALGRADAFVITGVDRQNRPGVDGLVARLEERFPWIPRFIGEYRPARVVSNEGDERGGLANLQGVPLFGFAGIAQPDSFRQMLERAGLVLVGFRAFGDHHSYCRQDIQELVASAQACGASALIATEKDLVKLGLYRGELPLLGLQVNLYFGEPFDRFVTSRLDGLAQG